MNPDPLRPPETDLDRIVWLVDSPDLYLLERYAPPYLRLAAVAGVLLVVLVVLGVKEWKR